MIARTILSCLCGLISCSAWAEEITLAHAIDLAVEHAPAMRAAEAGRDLADQEAAIGESGLLPRVEASADYQLRRQKTHYDEPQTVFRPNLKYRESTVTLRAVQPLFDLERWAGYRQGMISAESGEMKLRMERQRVMLETAQAALDMLASYSAVQAATAREQAAEQLAVQSRATFEAGVSPVNERLDAESRRDLVRAERIQAENNYEQAREKLASLTGAMVDGVQLPVIAGELQLPQPATPDAWGEWAVSHALPARLSRLQWQSAEQENTKAWGSNLPKVEAYAQLQGNRATSGQLGGTRSRSDSLGVQVSMPVFSSGGGVATIRKGQKAVLQAEFSMQDDIRLARLSARQAFRAYVAALAELKAMRQAIITAREAAEAARMGREVGLRTVSEVLDADERRFTAEKDLAAAQAKLVFAELQLTASIGELDSRQLPVIYGKSPTLR
ncbi:MAG TPA: TolC family protein [Mariprofundaceae bacterium]|nr:TolC family protein [Mariprofundaceae bacterium]